MKYVFSKALRIAALATALSFGFTHPFHLTVMANSEHAGDCGDTEPAQRCTDCGCHMGHGSCILQHSDICDGPDDNCEDVHPGQDCEFEAIEGK